MAYPPVEPTMLHNHLMDVLHGGLAHPQIDAARKASYAKLLAVLTADQAKQHAQAPAQGAAPGQMGGVQQAPDEAATGYVSGFAPLAPHAPGGDLSGALYQRSLQPQNPLLALLAQRPSFGQASPLLAALAGRTL